MLLLLLLLGSQTLDEAEQKIAAGDPDDALPILQSVDDAGQLAHAQLVRLLLLQGTAHAFVDDKAAAVASFSRLLAMEPTAALPYDASPRVTFVFEEAREQQKSRRALDVVVEAPAVARLDEPIVVIVRRHADALSLVSRFVVRHRDKGQQQWTEAEAGAADAVSFALPARSSEGAIVDEAGRPGVLVEVQLVGLDARGSEVLVARPVEVPVGFDAPPPWYANPWMWSGIAAGAVVVTGSLTASLIVLNLPPETVPVTSP